MRDERADQQLTIVVELGGNVLHAVEREAIRQVLTLCGGNISAAARRLGLMRQSLKRKMDKLGLSATSPPAAPYRVQQK